MPIRATKGIRISRHLTFDAEGSRSMILPHDALVAAITLTIFPLLLHLAERIRAAP